jgi:hypothetical protein
MIPTAGAKHGCRYQYGGYERVNNILTYGSVRDSVPETVGVTTCVASGAAQSESKMTIPHRHAQLSCTSELATGFMLAYSSILRGR